MKQGKLTAKELEDFAQVEGLDLFVRDDAKPQLHDEATLGNSLLGRHADVFSTRASEPEPLAKHRAHSQARLTSTSPHKRAHAICHFILQAAAALVR